jgi:hypothetical protein
MTISLLPADLGFDIKATGAPVVLPAGPVWLTVSYLGRDGRSSVIAGNVESVAYALRCAGYTVKFDSREETPPQGA